MMIDIIFYVILLLAVFKGFRKGFVIALFSFLAFVIGLAAALKLSALVAGYLENTAGVSGRWLPFISFIIVFAGVVLLVNIGAGIIKKVLGLAMLGWADKLGGILFYLILYTFIFSIVLFFAEKTSLLSQENIEQSGIYPWISPWGPKVINSLGSILPVFKGMFEVLQQFFENAGQKLQAYL